GRRAWVRPGDAHSRRRTHAGGSTSIAHRGHPRRDPRAVLVRQRAAERHRAGRTAVGAPDLPERYRGDRLRGARPWPLPAPERGLARGLPQRLAAAPHPEDLAWACGVAAPEAA